MSTLEIPAEAPEAGARRDLIVRLDQIEFHDSGDPAKKNITTLRGHAAVFNSLSEDLGGFRELIEPGFFRAALRKKPDVRLLFNHDPNFVMGRTASGSLDIREDTRGLHVFAEVDKSIQWVSDLRKSMQRGDIDQMSFAFTLREDGDDWAVADDGTVIRTLRADGADEVFDVSVVTYPAYRATHVDMRGLLEEAIENGRLPELIRSVEIAADISATDVTAALLGNLPPSAVNMAGANITVTSNPAGGDEERAASPEEGEAATDVAPETVGEESEENNLLELKDWSRDQARETREANLRLLKALDI